MAVDKKKKRVRPPRIHKDKKGRRYIIRNGKRYYAPKNVSDDDILHTVLHNIELINKRRKRRRTTKAKVDLSKTNQGKPTAVVTSEQVLEAATTGKSKDKLSPDLQAV